jgi:cell division protein FtsL
LSHRQNANSGQDRLSREASKGIWTLPFFAFCGVAFLLLAYLCQSAQLVRIQYEVLAKREEVKELAAVRADLELKVQELTSLERVEKVAVNQLRMVSPEERHIIEVVWSKATPPQSGDEIAVVTE